MQIAYELVKAGCTQAVSGGSNGDDEDEVKQQLQTGCGSMGFPAVARHQRADISVQLFNHALPPQSTTA